MRRRQITALKPHCASACPLEQIEPLDTDSLTRQVIEDWHYWIGRGYEFG
ncbi:MAG: hypothetical protein IPM76_03265 [Chloroflexi bacterium]|nr:hypothetical protein [Chloroflexota bacterium]